MRQPDSFAVLMGILRYSSNKKIPADSRAIQRTLFKLSRIFPDVMKETFFDREGFETQFDADLDRIMMDGMLALSGSKLESIIIDDKIKAYFDNELSCCFSKEKLETIQKMGDKFPQMLRRNTSERYKSLVALESI
jgi:hypothetical protein